MLNSSFINYHEKKVCFIKILKIVFKNNKNCQGSIYIKRGVKRKKIILLTHHFFLGGTYVKLCQNLTRLQNIVDILAQSWITYNSDSFIDIIILALVFVPNLPQYYITISFLLSFIMQAILKFNKTHDAH